MTRIVRAGDLIGMPVITLDEARIVGEVRDVLFDPGQARLVGFTLRGRGLLSRPLLGYLPVESVRATGHDAVMIASEVFLIRDRDEVQERIRGQREAPGSEVVTESGTELGTVNDIVLEVGGEALTVVGYCVARPKGREMIVPAPTPPGEWSDVIVVPDGIESQAAEGLVGFSRMLEQTRHGQSTVGGQGTVGA